MPGIAAKAFSTSDGEVCTPKSTKVEAVDHGSVVKAARFTMEPG